MDNPRNHFKHAIAEGRTVYGMWMVAGSPMMTEAAGYFGYDFVVIDTEHTPNDIRDVLGQLQAVAGSGAAAAVRPAWNDPVLTKRVLDVGAQTLIFPMVQSADEAALAVRATHYPPAGIRGVAAMHRASRYGTVDDYVNVADAEICVVVQLETPQALQQLDAIAAVASGSPSRFVSASTRAGCSSASNSTQTSNAPSPSVSRCCRA